MLTKIKNLTQEIEQESIRSYPKQNIDYTSYNISFTTLDILIKDD